MAVQLTDYKVAFDNSYQEIMQKQLVAAKVMNMRLEPSLTYGGSVTRVALDISGVKVRTVVRNAASTIDAISDSAETLTINLEKEAVFELSDGEVTQTGPLNAMQFAGKEIARKLMLDLDGRCFAEIRNALWSFDNGDLTTGTSSGTAITLSATTVPQMVSRMSAKLKTKTHVDTSTNMVLVVDDYAASDIDQYLLSKNIDLAGVVFKNGYAGPIKGAELYVSETLPCDIVITSTGVVSDGDTLTLNGVVLTMKTALTPTAGEVLIGAAATNTIQNIAAFVNDPTTTTAQGVALTSSTDIDAISGIVATATSATVLTLKGTGTGRIVASESLTNFVITSNTLLAYYGKKGAIDLVVQDSKEVDIRKCADRRASNIFSSYLAGVKTFADGAKKFLQVKILVA